MKKCLPVLAFGLLVSTPAVALTVRELQVACVGMSDETKAVCQYYILGVADGAALEKDVVNDTVYFCIPPGIPSGKLETLVKVAMNGDVKTHPQDSTMPASIFIGAVLTKAFPCQASEAAPAATSP